MLTQAQDTAAGPVAQIRLSSDSSQPHVCRLKGKSHMSEAYHVEKASRIILLATEYNTALSLSTEHTCHRVTRGRCCSYAKPFRLSDSSPRHGGPCGLAGSPSPR